MELTRKQRILVWAFVLLMLFGIWFAFKFGDRIDYFDPWIK